MPRPNWIDDASIPNDAPLWRGVVVPDQIRATPDGEVPSLGAMVTYELSVSIGSETTPAAVIDKGTKLGAAWRLWEFTAAVARGAGCIVDRDPQDDDPAHAVVVRADTPGRRITDGQAKNLIRGGHWVDPAPPPPHTASP